MAGPSASEIRQQLLSALREDFRTDPRRTAIDVAYSSGTLTLSGEVDDVAAKRLTVSAAGRLEHVAEVVDVLLTRPAVPMGDLEIGQYIEHAWRDEPLIADCTLEWTVDGAVHSVHGGPLGHLKATIADGVVTLDGTVPTLLHKRLAGSLAWWVPGSRDVVNRLGVEPAEDDNDDKILEALQAVLDRDQLADASHIDASCSNAIVTLTGGVADESQRELIEFDAWTLYGVESVVNRLA